MPLEIRSSLHDRFAETFGFEPEYTEPPGQDKLEYEMLDEETFIHRIAGSLARNCRPYWRLDGKELDDPFSVNLFFQTVKTSSESQDIILNHYSEAIRDSLQLTVNPRKGEKGGKTENPFVILAYSTAGVNDINRVRSLDYHMDADVQDFIKATEDNNGQTIFDYAGRQGLGYNTPQFVTKEHFKNLRWKPWAS